MRSWSIFRLWWLFTTSIFRPLRKSSFAITSKNFKLLEVRNSILTTLSTFFGWFMSCSGKTYSSIPMILSPILAYWLAFLLTLSMKFISRRKSQAFFPMILLESLELFPMSTQKLKKSVWDTFLSKISIRTVKSEKSSASSLTIWESKCQNSSILFRLEAFNSILKSYRSCTIRTKISTKSMRPCSWRTYQVYNRICALQHLEPTEK